MDGKSTTIREAAREIEVHSRVDVVVCGGGSSGMTAALAAAGMGASVTLVETYGFLGGVNTISGVNGIGGWQHDLDGRPLIGGWAKKIMQELAARGGADAALVEKTFQPVLNRPTYKEGNIGCYWINSNPELMKITLDDMMEAAGVELLYHANAVAPIMEGELCRGVYVESKSGRQAVLSKVVIDCTGDADIAARAGCEWKLGESENGAMQPMSMIYTVGGYGNRYKLNYDLDNMELDVPEEIRGRYRGAIAKARENGDIRYNPNDIFCAATPVNPKGPSICSCNFTRVQGLSPVDVDQMTKAEIDGRKQVLEGIQFMAKYMDQCEDVFLISIPSQIGVRESRRIVGEYILTAEDIQSGARFDDGITRGIYLIDTHNKTEVGKPSRLTLLKQPYDIPYRCMLPRGVENIIVAGKTISGDEVAISSYRIMATCMALGEAAGLAAALTVKHDGTPRTVDTKELRALIVKNGGNVGEGIN